MKFPRFAKPMSTSLGSFPNFYINISVTGLGCIFFGLIIDKFCIYLFIYFVICDVKCGK